MVTYVDFGGAIAPLPEPPLVLALGALNLLQAEEDRSYSPKEISDRTKSLAKYGKPLTPEDVTKELSLTDFVETTETPSGLVFKLQNLF